METGTIILLIAAICGVGIILYAISMYNSIINTKNTVGEAFSAIDTVLQNRYNLLPNLIELVKQYMSHEASPTHIEYRQIW
jgi:LemA protein